MGNNDSKQSERDEVQFETTDDGQLTAQMRVHLSRMIAYAESADVQLQRQVAERLANEAVKRESSVLCDSTQ
jgi:hypothetical protein